jgi:hypothetical protein
MFPDHHPRTLLMAAKASSGVWSTVNVKVRFWLCMIGSLRGDLDLAFEVAEERGKSREIFEKDEYQSCSG